jgi:VanZ family protein
MNETIKPFLFFLILLVVIAYGSLGSGDTAEKFQLLRFEHSDKLMHVFMYFLLTVSLIYGMVKKTGIFFYWKVYLVVVAIPISYGIVMEILQFMLTSDRQAEIGDFLANLTGTGLAFFGAFFYYSFRKGH